MAPTRRPSGPPKDEPVDDLTVEKEALGIAIREIARRQGAADGFTMTSVRFPKLTRLRLAFAAVLEPGHRSMNDVVVTAVEEWLDRNGYPKE